MGQSSMRVRLSARAGAATIAWLCLGAAADPEDPWSGPIRDELQKARQEAGVVPLERRSTLDEAARRRARQVAALPHRDRLTVSEPIGSLVRAAGETRYRNVAMHLDLVRGYDDPAAAFLASWRKHRSWERFVGKGFDSIGLAVEKATDGWMVLVAVLLESPRTLPDVTEMERAAFEGVNAERVRAGLEPLVRDAGLDDIARSHSQDMARRGYFAHESPEGEKAAGRLTRAGRTYQALAENIHFGQGNPAPAEVALASWMESPGHRQNVLDPRYQRTGVGVAVDPEEGVYFTQVFIAP